MSLRALVLALLFASAGCSALVAPDPARLGGDGGPGANRDAFVAPGTDAGPGGCATGEIRCGGVCVTPASDPAHCGSCTRTCDATQSCVSGVCTGPGGGGVLGNPSDCGPSHAVCTDLRVCLAGSCVCRTPYTDVGGTCTDLTSDPNNCGSPGNRCPRNCAGGVCVGGDCPPGTTSCDGACVDLRRDPGNCGDCGRSCRATQVCIGQCRDVSVPAGCTTCPCDCGGGAQCCQYPGVGVPVCIDGVDFCPG